MIHSKASQKPWVATPISVKLAGIDKTQNHDAEKHRASKMSYNNNYTNFMAAHSETELRQFDGFIQKRQKSLIIAFTHSVRAGVPTSYFIESPPLNPFYTRMVTTVANIKSVFGDKKACLGLNYLDSCTQLLGFSNFFGGKILEFPMTKLGSGSFETYSAAASFHFMSLYDNTNIKYTGD